MMHQPADGDPKYTGPNGPTPLHRVAPHANVQLGDLWLSQRPDDHACRQVSATYAYERGYQVRLHTLKFPGCHSN